VSRRLEGKVAVTGAGEAVAHKFAKEGASVIVSGLPGEIEQYGSKANIYAGDAQEFHALRTKAIDTYGQLDILVNNAGVFLATKHRTTRRSVR